MSKKLYALLAVIGVAIFALTACNGTTAVDPDTEEPTEAETEPTEASDTEDGDMEEDGDTEDGDMEEADLGALTETDGLLTFEGDCEASAVQGITAVDENTVEFTLCNPDPAFLQKTAFAAFHIQPREWFEETGGTGELLENPIGTGPYAIEEWQRGESVIFTAFPDHWNPDTQAQAETLVFRWNAEGAARLTELSAGQVDGIDNPSPDDYAQIEDAEDLTLYNRDPLNVFYLAMTNTFEPFGDPAVRQAIAMGIDRQRIVDNFYPGGSSVPDFFTPCAIENACVGDAWYEFDAEAARTMLADAGYPDGFETTIYYRDVFRNYLPEPGQVAVEIQTQLEENLGITAEVVPMESGEFIAESTTGSLDGFYLLGWGADYPHVTNFLDYHFGQNNPQFGDPHPEIYEPLAEAATIVDPAEAEPLYVEANNAIRDLVPMVPIAHGSSAAAYLTEVEGAFASPLSNEFFAVMDPAGDDTFVWMQNAEPISLFCHDESDGESLRVCEQVTEGLYAYEPGGTDITPALATSCEPNEDGTVWTCSIREDVSFHDGSTLDANDVVMSWAVGLDASNPYHVGNTGTFTYWDYLWGVVNQESSEE